MRALRIHEAATDEAAEAAAWHEKERPGLGTELEHADTQIDVLSQRKGFHISDIGISEIPYRRIAE